MGLTYNDDILSHFSNTMGAWIHALGGLYKGHGIGHIDDDITKPMELVVRVTTIPDPPKKESSWDSYLIERSGENVDPGMGMERKEQVLRELFNTTMYPTSFNFRGQDIPIRVEVSSTTARS